jgi:DnaK suppressor protein
MKKKELDAIKQRLVEDKERIIRNALSTRSDIQDPNLDDLNDEVDIASSEINYSLNLRLRDREALLLSKIDKTLKRIEDEDFGLCELCGDEIGIKRMLARPVATLCIRCKEEQEKVEKGYAD